MHLCYVDESGSTGSDLTNPQQPVFVMAGLLVSDERWRGTEKLVRDQLIAFFGGNALPAGFELHAHQLLSPNGDGPFAGKPREERNALALALLKIPSDRNHQVLVQVIDKAKMASATPPDKDYGFDWKHPWDLSLAATLTMVEEYLRGPGTGSTSTGMVFIDHEDSYLDLVRDRSKLRRESGGWRELKKVMEIGYSAVSHANNMIQLVDLIAYTMKKRAESKGGYGASWPPEAHTFAEECHELIWPRTKYKNLIFNKLNVPADLIDYLKLVRKPGP